VETAATMTDTSISIGNFGGDKHHKQHCDGDHDGHDQDGQD